MAKFTLELEEDYNYDLIGICSNQRDYRVCWSLNEHFGLYLEKSIEPFMVSGRKGKINSSHSYYEYLDETEDILYSLIKNKDTEYGKFIVPEKNQIDYFLIVKDAGRIEINDFIKDLKNISSVLTALSFKPQEIKSAKKFIF